MVVIVFAKSLSTTTTTMVLLQLGPVLANIFLGFCECRIPDYLWPCLYRRFVNDTFGLLDSRDGALAFLRCLNELHPSLQFTMESEDNGQLPFMDVRVRIEENVFTTAIYRKPTFTGLYTRWDSYGPTSQKIALVRSLVQRARKICSPQYLDGEVKTLQSIFEKNGYPGPIVSRVTQQTLESEPMRTGEQRKVDKVFMRLPWLGPKSAAFRNRIHRATIEALPDCKAVCTFTTRRLFNTCKKDVLPAESLSNVIYFFNCACEQSYVGRTSQRLEERIKQHIPARLVKVAESQKAEPKKKGKKKRKKKKKKTTENQGSASAEGGNQGKNVTLTTEQGDDSACESDANQQVLKVAKSDSGITRHLKTSSKCRDVVCRSNFTSRFKVIARARNASHLGILEALFIERYTPELCAQKEFVCTLGLF